MAADGTDGDSGSRVGATPADDFVSPRAAETARHRA